MRLAVLVLAALALSACAAAQECGVSLADAGESVRVVVESCSSVGSYSIGGQYAGRWEKLTFNYPEPWRGTFTTFNVDGEVYCTSDDPRDCKPMDAYVTEKPSVKGNSVESAWTLPAVKVKQTLNVSENHTTISYVVRNTDNVNHTVKVRLHIDTMLGLNDGAPIYIPGDGLKTSEADYSGSGLDFEYWKAYNQPDQPTIVATCTIDPKAGNTYPTRVVIADWKRSKDTAWDYKPESRPITGDSAVLLYYDLGVVEPGGEGAVSVGLGAEEPVLTAEQGAVGVAEITLGRVTGMYCPGDDVNFKVDVLSTGAQRTGRVGLIVTDGVSTYFNNTVEGVFQDGKVETLTFNWPVPEFDESKSFTVMAVLYNETGVADVKERRDAVSVELSRCVSPIIQVGGDIFKGMLFVAAVVAVGLLGILIFYLWYNQGAVEFAKHVDGENVAVKVVNNTRRTVKDVVIEDTIPGEAEIRIRTIGVLRRQNTLAWEVGELKPEAEATLEYWVKDGRAVGESHLRWSRGSKRLK